METLAYVVFGSFLAIGINLGWSWWIISAVAITGIGLVVWALNAADWLRPALTAAITVAVVLAAPPVWQQLNGHLPFSLSTEHPWTSLDTKVAASVSTPAATAKATALLFQQVKEDKAADEVAKLLEDGKTQEAMDYIQKLSAEGRKVRAVVSGDEPPTPATPAKTQAPAKATTPPVKKAAKVAPVVPAVVVPAAVNAGATPATVPPAVTSPTPETWTIRFSRDGERWETQLSVAKNGSHITMRATDGTTYEGDFANGCYRGDILMNGRPNGTFFVSFSANEGSGEWFDNRKIAFKMWRVG
ncbi:MAG: hypothetical protein Q8L10_00180 [Candidatus Moranbacteria bacterium]|nr:hypothetical protein [Candidatus Moranbacteria bacterium]